MFQHRVLRLCDKQTGKQHKTFVVLCIRAEYKKTACVCPHGACGTRWCASSTGQQSWRGRGASMEANLVSNVAQALHMVLSLHPRRDKETGKQRGFAFLAYEDQRSTVLAVDNLSGARVGGRTIRVDHVDNYKIKRAEASDALAALNDCSAARTADSAPDSSSLCSLLSSQRHDGSRIVYISASSLIGPGGLSRLMLLLRRP